ncbi:MAG: hypothetical protein AB1505_03885 [Candidatus Latescibacterota bacterium]
MAGLLWKEWRENLYKVGVGLGLSLLLLLLRQWETFNASFANVVPAWAGVIGCLMAGVLAMEVVAGERSRGTMDFLLARPTTPLGILLPKFAAGALALLLVVAGFWLMVYWVPFPATDGGSPANWMVADVPWPLMVLTWFLPLVAAYALVFFTSAATENPAEAAAAGSILGMASLLGYLFLAEMWLGRRVWGLVALMLDLEIGWGGGVVRTATNASVQGIRLLIAAAVVAAALGGSLALLGRREPFSVQRRTIVVAGFVLVALGLTVPPLIPSRVVVVEPVAEVPLDSPGRGLLSLPWAGPATFAAVHGNGIRVFSAGPAGTGPPVAHGHFAAPGGGGGVWQGVVAGGRVWLARAQMAQASESVAPDDPDGWEARAPAHGSQGTQILGVAVDDPDAPALLGSTTVGAPDSAGALVALEALQSGLLVLATTGEGGPLLTALAPQADGTVREVSRLAVAQEEESADPVPAAVVEPGEPERFAVAVAGDHVYLGLRFELVTVDARDPGHLRVSSRLRMEPSNRFHPRGPRHVAVFGHRLHVARYWPSELVILDLSDAGSPQSAGAEHRSWPLMGARPLGGLVYRYEPGALLVYDADHLGERRVHLFRAKSPARPGLWFPGGAGLAGRPLLLDGRLLAVLGDRLAVFELPERLRRAAGRRLDAER